MWSWRTASRWALRRRGGARVDGPLRKGFWFRHLLAAVPARAAPRRARAAPSTAGPSPRPMQCKPKPPRGVPVHPGGASLSVLHRDFIGISALPTRLGKPHPTTSRASASSTRIHGCAHVMSERGPNGRSVAQAGFRGHNRRADCLGGCSERGRTQAAGRPRGGRRAGVGRGAAEHFGVRSHRWATGALSRPFGGGRRSAVGGRPPTAGVRRQKAGGSKPRDLVRAWLNLT